MSTIQQNSPKTPADFSDEPFVSPGMSGSDLGHEERQAVSEVLASGHLSIGPRLEMFEQRRAKYVGSSFAAGLNSGTSALHVAVIAAGITDGDLAITSPFSFVASANCLQYERGLPVFVAVDLETGNLDPDRVCDAIADMRKATSVRL